MSWTQFCNFLKTTEHLFNTEKMTYRIQRCKIGSEFFALNYQKFKTGFFMGMFLHIFELSFKITCIQVSKVVKFCVVGSWTLSAYWMLHFGEYLKAGNTPFFSFFSFLQDSIVKFIQIYSKANSIFYFSAGDLES